ncbi:recombinase RecT [Amycolatopsis sp. NPDC051758]|uniref:recombinase RecT n=1 Tax=Amycolatopsis sp. NPDC051758 TaxID=3363935 RepID=UPI00379ADE1D
MAGRILAHVAQRAVDTAGEQDHEHDGHATATLLDQIAQSRDLFAQALRGSDIDPDQFVSNALNLVQQDLLDPDKKTKIFEAQPESVIGALLNCAQYGLRPGPFKEAWIIPKRKRGGIVMAEFQAHYRGLQRMAQAHPEVLRITTRVVYERDLFAVEEGTINRLTYEPLIGSVKDRGSRVVFFSLAMLANGESPFVWWHDKDMTNFRDKFVKAGERSPWFDPYGYDAMGRKTVLLRLLDEIPRQTRLVDLIAVDGTVRRDLDPAAPGYQVGERLEDQEDDVPPEPDLVDLDAAASGGASQQS